MGPMQFVEALSQLNFENTFNPYSDRCPFYDRNNAPQQRLKMLRNILKIATKQEIDSIWVGRDLGYRGGRRTGLALTDDVHIHEHGERWKLSVKKLTKGEAVTERTAAIIWRVLPQIEKSIFLWNVFPLHPHRADNQLSNRSHNSRECKAGEDFLDQLILILKPRRLVAIGNDAARTAYRLSNPRKVVKVRHPSYGGQTRFFAQMRELYDLPLE